MYFFGNFWSANQHRVQLHEIHLNFDNNCQVVSNFQDADYNTFLNVRQIPGLCFLYAKFKLAQLLWFPPLHKKSEVVPTNQVSNVLDS